MPAATIFNGPVVDITDQLARALSDGAAQAR
jgi:hypothetical protein